MSTMAMTSETIAPLSVSKSAPPTKMAIGKPKRILKDEDDYDDECNDETRSVDSDDAGSLVEFIVNDEDDNANDEDDNESVESDGPKTEEEARQRDLDGIDLGNIITGRRVRRQTAFYEHTVFNTEDYRRMMLDDVPDEEMHALEESSDSDDDDDDDDENDDVYTNEESDDDDDDDDDLESSPYQKTKKPRSHTDAVPN